MCLWLQIDVSDESEEEEDEEDAEEIPIEGAEASVRRFC